MLGGPHEDHHAGGNGKDSKCQIVQDLTGRFFVGIPLMLGLHFVSLIDEGRYD
jgi:hypothetical protein